MGPHQQIWTKYISYLSKKALLLYQFNCIIYKYLQSITLLPSHLYITSYHIFTIIIVNNSIINVVVTNTFFYYLNPNKGTILRIHYIRNRHKRGEFFIYKQTKNLEM